MSMPSELKRIVADKLREAFKYQYDVHLNIFAGDFRTADGFWRRADVYRWQIYGELFLPTGIRKCEISCWASLTMCRTGVLYVSMPYGGFGDFDWEADPTSKSKREEYIAKDKAENERYGRKRI